jgi:uncharacterized membrane protein
VTVSGRVCVCSSLIGEWVSELMNKLMTNNLFIHLFAYGLFHSAVHYLDYMSNR